MEVVLWKLIFDIIIVIEFTHKYSISNISATDFIFTFYKQFNETFIF